MARRDAALSGAAIGMALLEAASAQARPLASAAVRINARNTPAPSGDMYLAGRGLLAAGDVTGAMAAFRQALIAAPQSADALNGLAVCYDRLGRYDLSRGYYESALAIDPGSPLVLNNLGYSLYLQGQYDAAIPLLQRAGADGDPAISTASQRVLALVAAAMREAAIRGGPPQQSVETMPPQARIEMLASGEQRLVLEPATIDSALAAALGDRAALVTIMPAAVVPADGVAAAGDVFGPDLTLTASGELPTVVYLSTDTPTTARTMTLATPLPTPDLLAASQPAQQVAGNLATNAAAPPLLPASTTPPITGVLVALAPMRPTSIVLPAWHRREAGRPATLAPMPASSGRRNRDGDPAWLLASRRSERPAAGPSPAGTAPGGPAAVAAFDSDIAELNRFAERMRGIATPADPTVDREAAVARLEALIARIRAA